MTEEDYRRVTHDVTVAAAATLARLNPGMTFVFVSGAGADSSEGGPRHVGADQGQGGERASSALPFKASYVFRPAFIQPLHGIQSRTRLYRVLYRVVAPLYPVLKALFPRSVTTTEQLGRAMLAVARQGAPKRVLENARHQRRGGGRRPGELAARGQAPLTGRERSRFPGRLSVPRQPGLDRGQHAPRTRMRSAMLATAVSVSRRDRSSTCAAA